MNLYAPTMNELERLSLVLYRRTINQLMLEGFQVDHEDDDGLIALVAC